MEDFEIQDRASTWAERQPVVRLLRSVAQPEALNTAREGQRPANSSSVLHRKHMEDATTVSTRAPPKQCKLDYPRPWKANMMRSLSAAQPSAAAPAKKKVGSYNKPWLSKPLIRECPSCPPVKHTINVSPKAGRRAQVWRSIPSPALVCCSPLLYATIPTCNRHLYTWASGTRAAASWSCMEPPIRARQLGPVPALVACHVLPWLNLVPCTGKQRVCREAPPVPES
jgi:hypothetical protein